MAEAAKKPGPLALLLMQDGPSKKKNDEGPSIDEQLDSIADEAMTAMQKGDKGAFRAALRSFVAKSK